MSLRHEWYRRHKELIDFETWWWLDRLILFDKFRTFLLIDRLYVSHVAKIPDKRTMLARRRLFAVISPLWRPRAHTSTNTLNALSVTAGLHTLITMNFRHFSAIGLFRERHWPIQYRGMTSWCRERYAVEILLDTCAKYGAADAIISADDEGYHHAYVTFMLAACLKSVDCLPLELLSYFELACSSPHFINFPRSITPHASSHSSDSDAASEHYISRIYSDTCYDDNSYIT